VLETKQGEEDEGGREALAVVVMLMQEVVVLIVLLAAPQYNMASRTKRAPAEGGKGVRRPGLNKTKPLWKCEM
jgi:hypothetical protein